MAVQTENPAQPAQAAQIIPFSRPYAPGEPPADFFRFFSCADIIIAGRNIPDIQINKDPDIKRVIVGFSRSLQNSSPHSTVALKANIHAAYQGQLITGVICDVRFDADRNPAITDYMKRAITAAQFVKAPVSFAWGELFVMVDPNSTIEKMESWYQRYTRDLTPQLAERDRRTIAGMQSVRSAYETKLVL